MKIDYCGGHDSPAGHHSMSKAMNATGRNMVLALCRGPYQGEDHWGYAPEESMSAEEMHKLQYTGIRPAPGSAARLSTCNPSRFAAAASWPVRFRV